MFKNKKKAKNVVGGLPFVKNGANNGNNAPNNTLESDIEFQLISCYFCNIYHQFFYKNIYKTTNKISKLFNKKNFLVFFENEEFKCVDLESFEVDKISIRETPVDFCVM